MTRTRATIVGSGAFGMVLADYLAHDGSCEVIGFLDDAGGDVLGAAIDPEAVARYEIERVYVSIGRGDVREWIATGYRKAGIELATFVHRDVNLPSSVDLGAGSLVLPGCVVMPFATIGDGVTLSTGTGVAHHTSVGDFSSLASGARLGASIRVGKRVSLGVSATVMTGVQQIGDDVRVGAGAVVIRDVEPGATVVGVPARPLPQASPAG